MNYSVAHISPLSAQERDDAIAICVSQVRAGLPVFGDAAQNHTSVNNFYPAVANDQWTSGFWPGTVWLAYEATKDGAFADIGRKQVQSFLHRIQNKIATDHHDMGFMYSPSCVSAWKLVGDEDGREAGILAAQNLLNRFHEKGQFLQAWGRMDDPNNYRFIIDCLLNLPLLYWAGEETKDPNFAQIADQHAATTLEHGVRENFSTFHTYFFDPETGAPSHGATAQGYADDSDWARGQAWAITGVAFLYRFDPKPEYLGLFDKLLDYFVQRLPQDLVPYWDLIFTEGDEPRDSSAAAIVACGLLELAELVGDARGQNYHDLAARMMGSLVRHYAVMDPAVSNGLILHGTYSKKTEFNTCRGEGVDECTSWGDYFYFEALMRLRGSWKPYW